VPNLRTGGRAAGHSSTGLFRARSGTPAFPVGGPSAMTLQLQALFARAFASSSMLRRKMKNAGDVADFVDWQLDRFGTSHIYSRREDLWEGLMRRLDSSEPLTVLEFGVAWGYSTQWWLARLEDPNVVWHGFDRFTGLPRPWRGLRAGAFDAEGKPPEISDARLRWHVGDVEERLPELPTSDLERARRLVLFDLDIYEPTAVAWSYLAPWLRAGDLLYFDEAMDDDERKVLDELVLPTGAVEYIGATASALALVVTRPVPPLS
jgi:hypothetical protein